jgi:hypothetical protein
MAPSTPLKTNDTDINVLKAVLAQLNVSGLDYDRLARDLGEKVSKSAAQQRWYKCRDIIFGKPKAGNAGTPAKKTGQTPVKNEKTPVKTPNKRIQTPKRSGGKKTGGKRKRMSDEELTEEEMTEEEEEEEEAIGMHTSSESPTRVLPQRKARGLVRSKSMIDIDTESEGGDWEMMGVGEFGEVVERENKKVKRENVKLEMESGDSEVSDWGAGI